MQKQIPNGLKLDANKFLKLIHGDEGKIYFRRISTFAVKYRFPNTYDKLKSTLQKHNEEGFNIYFAVNGGGHTDEEIDKINAGFVDFDVKDDIQRDLIKGGMLKDEAKVKAKEIHRRMTLEEIEKYKKRFYERLNKFPIPPTLVVNTRNGIHAYWLLHQGVSKEQFVELQHRLIKYFESDTTIHNPSRLMRVPDFYWYKQGFERYITEVVHVDDGRYHVNEILNDLPELDQRERIAHKTNLLRLSEFENPDVLLTTQNIEFIIENDHESLRNILNVNDPQDLCSMDKIPWVTNDDSQLFTSRKELYDHLKQQDLSEFLGIDHRTQCIFHDDDKPSAGIFIDKKTGFQYYKCHGAECGVSFNIISFVEVMLKDPDVAMEFLCKVFNVRYEESEWRQKQNKILDENMFRLDDVEDFVQQYPNTYKLSNRYFDIINLLHVFTKNRIYNEDHVDKNGNPIFYISTTEITNRVTGNKDRKAINKRISLLVYLGFLNKIHPKDLPTDLYISAKNYQKKSENKYLKSHYSIPRYSATLLHQIEERAKFFKESNLTIAAFTRDFVYSFFGQDEAKRVFPQLSNIDGVREETKQFEVELVLVLFEMLEQNGGYVKQEALVNRMTDYWREKLTNDKSENKQKIISGKYASIKVNQILPNVLDSYGLQKKRFTNELKQKFGVTDCQGQPYVIIRS